jgi:LysR family nitrogen assimilation transcriptional regulator
MDIRQFRYFVSIVECGSLSKAAEQLYIAQPSLSLQIRTLESELKTKLLLRSSQGVRPTEAGKILYRHARAVLRQMEEIAQEIKHGAGSAAGEVAVGFPTTIAAVLAQPLFSRIRTRYPGIYLQLRETTSGYLAELLANGRLDMAVLFRDMPTRGASVQPLFDEDLCVYGQVALRKGGAANTCPLQQLDGVPLVLPNNTQALRLIVERSFAQTGLHLNVVADIDSLRTRMLIAQEGSACTILAASNELILKQEKIRHPPFRRLVDPGIRRPVSMCWPNSLPPNSASIAVYHTIIELVRELVHGKALTGVHLLTIDETGYELAHPASLQLPALQNRITGA